MTSSTSTILFVLLFGADISSCSRMANEEVVVVSGSLLLILPFQQILCFSSRVVFGTASSSNRLRWISPCKLEHSFLAMAVKLHSLCMLWLGSSNINA